MRKVYHIKKQKALSKKEYDLYLSNGPEPADGLSNTYNLLDDLNTTDKAMIKRVDAFVRKLRLKTTRS